MFFDEIGSIQEIARHSGTAIFVVPDTVMVDIKGSITISPSGKNGITIDQVRSILGRLSVRQTSDLFIIIRPADALNDEAANALLKNLEEPGDKVHFVLVTASPSRLLPTILSRASLYFWRQKYDVMSKIEVDTTVKDLAKKLMVAKPVELVVLAEQITKHKDNVREFALSVVGTAIEMLYKSYYLTSKPVFLKKIPKFLEAYDAINKNGHIKLHLVADLC